MAFWEGDLALWEGLVECRLSRLSRALDPESSPLFSLLCASPIPPLVSLIGFTWPIARFQGHSAPTLVDFERPTSNVQLRLAEAKNT